MCFGYFRDIIIFSKFLHLLLRVFKHKDKRFIDKLAKITKRCGPLAIKLVQYILMNNDHIEDLEFVFENCNSHYLSETEQVYFNDFGRRLYEDYSDITLVASGSIGQVYRAFSRERESFVAIKVKHPDIKKAIDKFIFMVRVVCFVIRPFNKFHEIIMQYLDGLKQQLDYSKEALNTIILRDNWIDEPLVVIPEVYQTTNNFIIMSYHEGKNFNELSEKQQKLTGIYMNVILLKSVLIDDFLHSDLHTGNWKVDDTGDLKIIIYDCGMISQTGNTEYNKRIVRDLLSGSYENLLYTVADPKINIEKLKKYQSFITKNLPLDHVKRVRFFIDLVLANKITRDSKFISSLTAFGIVGKITATGTNVFINYINENQNSEILIYIYIGLLKNFGSFGSLRMFLENWMNSDPAHKKIYNTWLIDNFGHKKGYILDNIIYEKFK
jgi:hypothetical protein